MVDPKDDKRIRHKGHGSLDDKLAADAKARQWGCGGFFKRSLEQDITQGTARPASQLRKRIARLAPDSPGNERPA
jgi:hypothetical protein